MEGKQRQADDPWGLLVSQESQTSDLRVSTDPGLKKNKNKNKEYIQYLLLASTHTGIHMLEYLPLHA